MRPAPFKAVLAIFFLFFIFTGCTFSSDYSVGSAGLSSENSSESSDTTEPEDSRIQISLTSDASYLVESVSVSGTPGATPTAQNLIRIVSQRPVSTNTVIQISYSGTFLSNDFISLPSSLTLSTGQSEKFLVIEPHNDTTAEPFKNIRIHLSSQDENIVFERTDYNFEFRDDDSINFSAQPFYQSGLISNHTTSEGSSDPIKFVLSASTLSASPPSFDLKFKLKSIEGTLNAADITEDISELVYPTDASSTVLEFHIQQDAIPEGAESAILTYELANASMYGSRTFAITLNALDDEIPTLQIQRADLCSSVYEPNTSTCKASIVRSGDLSTPLTANLKYSGSATQSIDFQGPTSIQFNPGESTATFDILFKDDTAFEESETLTVHLEATEGQSCFCNTPLSYTISDNDAYPEGRSIEITGLANSMNSTITLNWSNDYNYANYKVYRRILGQSTWGTEIASLTAPQRTFTDYNISDDTTYEYKVERSNGKGFAVVSFNRAPIHTRGRVLIIAESTIAAQLATELDTWKDLLVGDGWQVIVEQANASDTPPLVKSKIISHFQHPESLKTVILFGHVPVPYSGQYAPDGHSDHIGAWPADVYYGELDGAWTDTSVNITNTRAANINTPGDGKFDNIYIPTTAEIAVGRIDLSNLPAFAPLTEVQLLQRYIQKMKDYRTAAFQINRRALIDDNFGDFYSEAFSQSPWNWFGNIVGRSQTFAKDFRTELATQNYLWAYACGGGTFSSASGVGTTTDLAAQPIHAVFTSLFGSYFGDWNTSNNFLRAPLAASGKALTSVWSGRPNWTFHSLAAGEPMIQSILSTWNNPSYLTHYNDRSTFTGFMGDPTLRDYMLKPVSNIQATQTNDLTISWTDTEMVDGYFVYASSTRHGQYHLLTPTPLTTKSFSFIADENDRFIMIRSVKREDTFGGTFHNLSTGTLFEIP